MKKLAFLPSVIFIIGSLIFSSNVFAQISINQADLPSAGLIVVTDSNGAPSQVPGPAQPTTQFWDFSGLVKQKAHTIKFMAPGSTPYSSVPAFSSATLADSTYGGNGYNFLTSNLSTFAGEGAEEIKTVSAHNFQIEIGLSPLFAEANFPATYGSIVAPGVAKGIETFSVVIGPITEERFTAYISYSDTVDAWGTMKMPNGKTYNVLRQKHHELDIDSVFGYIINTWTYVERLVTYKNQYDWYANGVGYILAEMDMGTTFDTAAHDIIWDTTVPASAGISEIGIKKNVSVYPNPANSEITFNTYNLPDADQHIFIYDVTGRQLERIVIKNGVAILNTGAYSNGVYLYNLTDNSGDMLDRGKFIIQH